MDLFVDGLKFPEAPRWHDGALWFSDMIGHRVCRASADGELTTVATFDEMPGGLGFLPDGTPLVAGMHSARLYAIRDEVEVYCELADAARGHLDDMTVAADGTAYAGGVGVMTSDAIPSGGAILRVTPSGEISREASDLAFPNGMAITPDGRTLLCNETFGERILAFPIRDDGSLGERTVWAETPGLHPDGLCLDAEGAAWIGCFSENRFIRVLAGGAVTQTIETPGRWATGIALGGADGHSLFVIAADTDQPRFFRGDSTGSIGIVRVDVPAA